MKFLNSKLIAMTAGLALCAGMAVAQDETAPPPPPRHAMHRGFEGGPEFGMFLHKLNLTDDQKAQVKQIFQNEKQTIKPLREQEMTAHEQLLQLITSGSFEQGKASAIVAQESQTHLKLEMEHAKIGAQIYQLLTPDQKTTVSQMLAQHQQRMQQHMQNQQQAAPQSE